MNIQSLLNLRERKEEAPTPRKILERRIIEKVLHFEAILEEGIISKGTGCLHSCLELSNYGHRGESFLVGEVYGVVVSHFYYVPPGAKRNDFALNQADQGYGQYPKFTVEELRVIGKPVFHPPL